MTPRRIPRSLYEEARDVARALAKTKAFEPVSYTHLDVYKRQVWKLGEIHRHTPRLVAGQPIGSRAALRVHRQRRNSRAAVGEVRSKSDSFGRRQPR